ncbi:MAG: hypothetical protein U9Q34_08080 [Elusimicrobiota bacterium]|nr:hypothetical protein [Elusimicrobiota bacterium]
MNKKEKWKNASLTLKLKYKEQGISSKVLEVHLERRLPGKFGRLKIMSAIINQNDDLDMEDIFETPSYRKRCLEICHKKLAQAGVKDPLRGKFMTRVYAKYPMPSEKELFAEEINNPIYKKILGPAWKKLSFNKTGVPKLTPEDMAIIKTNFEATAKKAESNPDFLFEYAKILMPNKEKGISTISENYSKRKQKRK